MSCLVAPRVAEDPFEPASDPCSWASIAAALRQRAEGLPDHEAADLVGFAAMLEGFAELDEG